jgi:type I restriction enzyme S subunit
LETVRLSEVCKTTSGGTPSRSNADFFNGNIPWVKSGELRDGPIFAAEEKITKSAIANSSAKVFPAGTLLIALYGATVGKLGILQIEAATNQAVCAIFPNGEVDQNYLFYYLLKQREFLVDSRTGGAQPNISQETIRDLPIPLPPLDEQRRIADILSRADRLRRLRRTALQLSDGYLQSVFLQMFGDPVENPRGWKSATVGDVVAFSQYGTSNKSNTEGIGYPVLGMGNITYSGHIVLDSLSYVDLSPKEFSELRLEPGDIIFNRTNSTELVGKTAHWTHNFDAVLASYLVKLQLKPNTLPDYFTALLNTPYFKRLFQERCKKAVGQSNVSPTLLKEFPVVIPPLALQQKFAGIVRQVERLRSQQREAARQAEELFQALLHQAFQ